jgi:hypothetical protein
MNHLPIISVVLVAALSGCGEPMVLKPGPEPGTKAGETPPPEPERLPKPQPQPPASTAPPATIAPSDDGSGEKAGASTGSGATGTTTVLAPAPEADAQDKAGVGPASSGEIAREATPAADATTSP